MELEELKAAGGSGLGDVDEVLVAEGLQEDADDLGIS